MLFVVNPYSGKGLVKNYIVDIIDIFIKGNMEVTVHITQSVLDACDVVHKKAKRYDMVVCSGGDGTLDEVITGMMKIEAESRCPVGYIPAGSTNDFGNSLGIPANMVEAANNIVGGKPYPCDIGEFNEDYFVYIAAFGAFTEVSYETKQGVKNVLGHMAYILEGAKRVFNIKSYKMKVRLNDEVIEEEFIYGMITNSISVGGIKSITGRNVKLNDGVFEVTLIKRPKNLIELQEIIGEMLIGEMKGEFFYCRKADSIEFEAEEEIPWTLDGEFGGSHGEVKITNHKQALSLMVSEIPKKIS